MPVTQINANALTLSGGPGVSLAVAANAVTINGEANVSNLVINSAAIYSSSTSNMVNTSASVVRMQLLHPISFSRVDALVSVSLATAATTATAAVDMSFIAVIYSQNNSTLNPIIGMSSTNTYTWASNTGAWSSLNGPRFLSFGLQTSLSAGEYWFGWQMSSHSGSSIGLSTTILSATFAPIHGTSQTAVPFADFGAATAATINNVSPLQGMNSVSISATNQTLQQVNITQTGATAQRANNVIILRGV